MKILALLLAIFLVSCVNCEMKFDEWKQQNGKSYKRKSEDDDALQKFNMNNAFIAAANSRQGQKYKLGLNEYSDKSFGEFRASSLGAILPPERGNKVTLFDPNVQLIQADGTIGNYTQVTAPAIVDYRNYSLGIKNQMSCGSCWAFSAIGTLESRMKILNSSYNTFLSEQYLIDCDTQDYGCDGGWPHTALKWIVSSGGNAIPAQKNYFYSSTVKTCKTTVAKISMNIKSVVQNYTGGDEGKVKQIVANVGPVSAAIMVSSSYQFYKSGIFFDSTCDSSCDIFDHAIIIVGYGTDPVTNLDYWIIKNSWGTTWGEKGYGYMARNRGNNCNIACYAIYAI